MLTYWFQGLPDPNQSKQFEIEARGFDPDFVQRVIAQYQREEMITKRLLRKLSAEAILLVIFKS